MFSECANPDCKKPFDFRFSEAHPAGGKRVPIPIVRSTSGCGICSEKYTLAYQEGWGVVMTLQRVDRPEEQDSRRFVTVA